MATDERTNDRAPASDYSQMHARMKELAAGLVGKSFGSQRVGDPRPTFLIDLEVGRITARAEMNAYMRLLVEHLEIPKATVVAYINEELGIELKRFEEELGDTGTPERN